MSNSLDDDVRQAADEQADDAAHSPTVAAEEAATDESKKPEAGAAEHPPTAEVEKTGAWG